MNLKFSEQVTEYHIGKGGKRVFKRGLGETVRFFKSDSVSSNSGKDANSERARYFAHYLKVFAAIERDSKNKLCSP